MNQEQMEVLKVGDNVWVRNQINRQYPHDAIIVSLDHNHGAMVQYSTCGLREVVDISRLTPMQMNSDGGSRPRRSSRMPQRLVVVNTHAQTYDDRELEREETDKMAIGDVCSKEHVSGDDDGTGKITRTFRKTRSWTRKLRQSNVESRGSRFSRYGPDDISTGSSSRVARSKTSSSESSDEMDQEANISVYQGDKVWMKNGDGLKNLHLASVLTTDKEKDEIKVLYTNGEKEIVDVDRVAEVMCVYSGRQTRSARRFNQPDGSIASLQSRTKKKSDKRSSILTNNMGDDTEGLEIQTVYRSSKRSKLNNDTKKSSEKNCFYNKQSLKSRKRSMRCNLTKDRIQINADEMNSIDDNSSLIELVECNADPKCREGEEIYTVKSNNNIQEKQESSTTILSMNDNTIGEEETERKYSVDEKAINTVNDDDLSSDSEHSTTVIKFKFF